MAILESINAAIAWLEQAKRDLELTTPPQTPAAQPLQQIAWGSKVSPAFKERVLWIAEQLGCDPSWLMACMAWESAETFSSKIKNAAGSGATGLIQFMPVTAKSLGTTVQALAAMSAEDQLRFVWEFFKGYAGRLHNLGDVYMAILWPKAVGNPDSFVLFDRAKTPITFRQNAGLDVNHNGSVTREECLVKIQQKLTKGLSPGYVG